MHLTIIPGLRVFLEVIEAGSVRAAATRLARTPAAVRQNLRAFETAAGMDLLSRRGREIVVTPQGLRYGALAREGLEIIAAAAARLRPAVERVLSVATTPLLASNWLIPRLADFERRHPGLEVEIGINAAYENLGVDGGPACAIRFGAGDWPGMASTLLFRHAAVAVAAPRFMRMHDVRSLEDLKRLPLLTSRLQPVSWQAWLQAAGVEVRDPLDIRLMETGNHALGGAFAGLGVTLIGTAFVNRAIAEGRLQQLLGATHSVGKGWYFVRPKGASEDVKAMSDWLVRQAHLAGLR